MQPLPKNSCGFQQEPQRHKGDQAPSHQHTREPDGAEAAAPLLVFGGRGPKRRRHGTRPLVTRPSGGNRQPRGRVLAPEASSGSSKTPQNGRTRATASNGHRARPGRARTSTSLGRGDGEAPPALSNEHPRGRGHTGQSEGGIQQRGGARP